MWTYLTRRWFPLCLALIVGFSFQGSRGLFESTEGRYAECAREMMATGQWLVPQLDYRPHWSKPPLTYWAIVAGMELLGQNAWGVRLFDAVAFFFIVLATIELGAALWDRATGNLAGVVAATSPFLAIAASSVSTDTLLTLWMVLTVLAYWKAVRAREDRDKRKWIIALWLFAGLGFFTKGPPALLPLLAVVVFHCWRKRAVASSVRIADPPCRLADTVGLALFAVTAFWWYLYAGLTHAGTMEYFLRDEVAGRVLSTSFKRNPEWYKPVTIYLPPLAAGVGLWLFYWPRAFRAYRPLLRWGNLKPALTQNDILLFLFLWLCIPLLVFSISRSRLQLYVAPLFPVIVLATARAMIRVLTETQLRKGTVAIAVVSAVLIVAGKGAAAYWPTRKDMRRLYEAIAPYDGPGTRLLLFKEQRLYGLQFYAGSALESCDVSSGALVLKRETGSAIMGENELLGPDPMVFIAGNHDAPTLARILDGAGVLYVSGSAPPGYVFFALEKDTRRPRAVRP